MRIDAMSRIHEAYRSQSINNTQKTNQVSQKDKVALSETAKDFQTIYNLLKETPDVREDKVQAIKEKMASGTYSVKAEEVAEKMLSQLDLRG